MKFKKISNYKSSNNAQISGYFLETASSINIEASFDILNSGSVFLKYLKTAEDLDDQRVILGFLSTICLTSAMCSSWILTSGDVCTLSSLRISLSLSSDVLLTSLISVSSF